MKYFCGQGGLRQRMLIAFLMGNVIFSRQTLMGLLVSNDGRTLLPQRFIASTLVKMPVRIKQGLDAGLIQVIQCVQ